jgi:uncharacterized surface anchored protein
MRNIRNKYLAILLALALILPLAVSPAFAAENTNGVDTDQPIGQSSEDFQVEEDRGDIPEDQVAWHFIFTGQGNQDKDENATLTVTFESGITVTTDVYKITGTATHFFVGTPNHDTIASVALDTTETSGRLVLSHVTHKVEEEILGALTIEKLLLDGNGTEISPDNTEFTVNIKGPEGYNKDHTFSVNNPLVLEELDLGKYIISEKNIPEDFELISIEKSEVTLSKDYPEATVVVTNQVIEDIIIGEPGALIVEKVLLDADKSEITDDDTLFTVNVKGEGYNQNHTFSVNTPLVLDDLDPGEYHITELDPPEGYKFLSISDAHITLSEDHEEDTTVMVTNKIEKEEEAILGSLTIEKYLLDADGETVKDNNVEFTVNVKGSDYNEDHTFSVNKPAVITELPLGEYTISEKDIPEGFELISIKKSNVTLSEAYPEATVVVTNKIEKEEEAVLGSLTIEKYLLDADGEPIDEDNTMFTVQVKGPYGYNEDHTFSVDKPAVIEDLALGEYSIYEKDIPEGYQLITIDDVLVTLSEEEPEATVVVANQVVEEDKMVGSITIEKLLMDIDDEKITDDDTLFTVNITGPQGYDEDHTFSVNESLKIMDLPYGAYHIEEVNIPDGYEFVKLSDDKVVLSADNTDAKVIVTNAVESDEIIGEPTTSLTIKKLLLDIDDEKITDDDTLFTVNITGPQGYNEDHTFSVNEYVKLMDLPYGAYHITEIDIPDGYKFVEQSDEMVVLSADNPDAMVTVTNEVVATDDIIDEEPPVDEIILDEEPPLGIGELPRTGQRHPSEFYVLGLMITGLGVFLKRFII